MLDIALSVEQSEITNKRQHREHIFGVVFFILVVALICGIIYSTTTWMLDDQRLPLSKIVLQGELKYVTAKDVQSAFGKINHIGTFMSQDINTLQKTVESLPWVAHAAIRKQWPDTIKVFLIEHHPVAIWNGNQLLNHNGVVFNGDIALLKEDKIKLYGPDNSGPEVLATYRKLQPQLQSIGLSISTLSLNKRRAWQIILDNGIRLELGKESLDERMARFFLLYRRLGQDTQKIGYIDLRYDTGAAVGWAPEE